MAADEINVCDDPRIETAQDQTDNKTSITLEILQIIKEAQQQHGLRHRDFQRYRSYCSRRLQRIRKSLKFVQKNRNKFTKKVITEDTITDIRFLYIPLVSAERAWSYAMQLKQESNTENRKRYRVITRLRKAVKHAEELEELCQSEKCDARSKLESQAYSAWMKGTLFFELSSWHSCIESFNNASTIYSKLGSAVTEDQKQLYAQRVEEIAPSIRYSAYNIGDESAIDDLLQMRGKSSGGEVSTDIDTLLAQTREKQAVTLSEVTWRGRTIPVRSERVRAFLITNKENEQELNAATDNDAKVSIYENLLMECKDALQILRDEIRADPVSRQRAQHTDEQVSTVQYLHTYLAHIRLSKTVERNVLMADSIKQRLTVNEGDKGDGQRRSKPQDLIRIYDIIIQSLGEIPQLPGLEEDEDVKQEIDAKILKYKAYRSFYLARTYSQAKKWREAAALFERAISHAETSLREWKSVQNGPIEGELREINALIQEINSLKYSAMASSILDSEEITKGAAKLTISDTKVPLIDRIDQYQTAPSTGQPNLVAFPPEFQPVPCKPLFFDIALNNIEFPSLEDKLDQKKNAPAGGISGWMRGWWGGDKK